MTSILTALSVFFDPASPEGVGTTLHFLIKSLA